MDVIRQIESGKLVCPETRQKLTLDDDELWLNTKSKTRRYRFLDKKTPIMLADPQQVDDYLNSSTKMLEEYTPKKTRQTERWRGKLKTWLRRDYRTEASLSAVQSLIDALPEDPLCLAVGGGPNRVHPTMTNVNIGPFPNVDVVADAHHLPYADECVDAVHSEAVFEHLANPAKAAKEVFRVLKTNGRAFVCTPFLQPYHGYPDHYQNFTLTGHRGLFESKGFEILEAGTCVGPVYTMANIMLIFLSEFSPAPLRRPLSMVWQMMSMAVRPLDKILNERKNSHVLASTTYLLARKPP